MVSDLDAALEPGETILFRMRDRVYRWSWFPYGSAVAGLALFLTVKNALMPPDGQDFSVVVSMVSVISGALVALWAVVIAVLIVRQRRSPDELIITDRRLLYSDGHRTQKSVSVALDTIERITWETDLYARRVAIVFGDQVLCLPKFAEEQELTAKLADAAGLDAVPDIGALAHVELRVFGYVLAGTIALLPLSLILVGIALPIADERLNRTLTEILLVLGWVAAGLTFGALVTNLLTVTLMRPFVTAEQMQTGLCAGQPDGLWLRMALGWAGYLYGRPLPYLAT